MPMVPPPSMHGSGGASGDAKADMKRVVASSVQNGARSRAGACHHFAAWANFPGCGMSGTRCACPILRLPQASGPPGWGEWWAGVGWARIRRVAPLAVDPGVLSAAGDAVAAVGDGVAAAVGMLAAGYEADTGQDAAGEMFGLAYQDAGESALKAAAAGINACRRIGFKVQVSASNYSRAEAASTLGGGGEVLPTPVQPGAFAAPGAPRTSGPGVPAPALWALVQAFVGDLWPNGDPADLHTAAGCWRTLAAALDGVTDELAGPTSMVGGQQIPEGELIQQAFSTLGTDMAGIGAQCAKLASALDDFAGEVARTQNAIRDLLHRLGSASGLFHEVVEVFKGHGLDEVKKVANDIKAVLHNLKGQAQAREHMMRNAMQVFDGLVRGLQTYVRGEITHYLGEDVGNPLATVFDIYVNAGEGVVKEVVGSEQQLEQLNPLRFAYDPKGAAATWEGSAKGLAETLLSGDPAMAPLVNALDPQFRPNLDKQLLHTDDWRGDRPGLGAGENLADVLMFASGLGEVGAAGKTTEAVGAAGKAELEAGGAAVVGRGGRAVGEVGEVAGTSGALGEVSTTTRDLTTNIGQVGTDLNKMDPAAGGRPSDLPPTRPLESPPAPVPRPGESAPAAEAPVHPPEPASTRGQPTTPPVPPEPAGAGNYSAPGAREPASAPSTGQHPAPGVAAPGQHLPPDSPAAEPVPARVPVSPGGSAAESAPIAAHAQPAPAPPAPHQPGGPGGGQGHHGPPDGAGRHEPNVHGDGAPPPRADGPPPPLPPGSTLFEGYHPGEPGPEFTNADGSLIYPHDSLPSKPYAMPGTVIPDTKLPAGAVLGRFGYPGGAYLAPEGTPFSELSLPPGSAVKPYYKYVVDDPTALPPGWHIEESQAAPWFYQPGGGTQYRILDEYGRNGSVEDLVITGFLRRVR